MFRIYHEIDVPPGCFRVGCYPLAIMRRSILTTQRLALRQIARPTARAVGPVVAARSRPYSLAQEELSKPSPLARIRFSHVFGGLAVLGLFVTTYGL
jgi:hypothetical protein